MRYFTFIVAAISLFLSAAVSAEPVNINTASPEVLAARIDGVGAKRAEAIIEYREEHGPFKNVEELQNISGIGPVLLENNRENLVVTSEQ